MLSVNLSIELVAQMRMTFVSIDPILARHEADDTIVAMRVLHAFDNTSVPFARYTACLPLESLMRALDPIIYIQWEKYHGCSSRILDDT